MALKKPIVIGAGDFSWTLGVGQSSYTGFEEMRNCDITTDPGAVLINYQTVKNSSTTITDYPEKIVEDAAQADLYLVDHDRKIYTSTDDGNTWSLVSGNTTGGASFGGLVVWKDHLLYYRNNEIEGYGPLSSSPAWNSSFITTLSGGGVTTAYRPIIVGEDDIVYYGDERYIGTIEEVSGQNFDDGTAATFTSNTNALDLPEGVEITSLTELGGLLAIGTRSSGNEPTGRIYFWDRTATTFRIPIEVREKGIRSMITIGNRIYFFAGDKGNLYVTDGSRAEFVTALPRGLLSTDFRNVDIFPNAIMHHKNKIYFGLSETTGSISPAGVWSYDIKSGVFNFENQLSTGNVTNLQIGALWSQPSSSQAGAGQYLIGYNDIGGASTGIDEVSKSDKYGSYAAYVVTPFIPVSTTNDPVTIETVEVNLAKELASGEGVRVSYRLNRTDSFTTLFTFDFATFGAISNLSSRQIPNGLAIFDVNNIQLKIELTMDGSGTNSPELLNVRLF